MAKIKLLALIVFVIGFVSIIYAQPQVPVEGQTAPPSGYQLPTKPPPPTGETLTKQILLAIFTVGGCTACGIALAAADAIFERKKNEKALKTVRLIENSMLGIIALVGVCLLLYAGSELLKSAGLWPF